ncbi:MAG: menaquinone biosynthesis protein [Verrucomicrobiota bacterium]
MNYPPLQSLKIGCVQYLNSVPLICAYEGEVVFEHPSRLAAMLGSGALDVALVPVFELFRKPDYKIADGISISSLGRVFSVFLAYRGELGAITQVSMDTASLTSVNLLRCILAEFHGLTPEYLSSDLCADDEMPRLLIGTQAIDFRRKQGGAWKYLDLGEEWTKQTGLPFVYALWLFNARVENDRAAAEALRQLKQEGIERLPEICREDPGFRVDYFTNCIRYGLGDDEKAGMRLFGDLLQKHGLVQSGTRDFDFI